MSILGSSSRIIQSGQGSFFCPRCNSEMRYTDQKVETHFTLFSLRLFPVGGASGYVECVGCKATYNHEVLEFDPDKDAADFQATFETAVLNSMVMMMVSDGSIASGEVSAIRDVYLRLTGRGISDGQVQTLAADIAERNSSLADYIGGVGRDLNLEGKEMVIRALYMIAAADGTIAVQEQELLDEAADALDISKTRIAAVIEETKA